MPPRSAETSRPTTLEGKQSRDVPLVKSSSNERLNNLFENLKLDGKQEKPRDPSRPSGNKQTEIIGSSESRSAQSMIDNVYGPLLLESETTSSPRLEVSHHDATQSELEDKTVSSTQSWVRVQTDRSRGNISEISSSIKGEQEIQEWARDVHKPTLWERDLQDAFDPSRHGHVMINDHGIHPPMYDRIHHNAQTQDLSDILPKKTAEGTTSLSVIQPEATKVPEMNQEIILKGETSNHVESHNLERQQKIHPAFREAWQELTQNLESLNQEKQRVIDKTQELTQFLQDMQQAEQDILPAINIAQRATDQLLRNMNEDHQEVNSIYQDLDEALQEISSEINQELQETHPGINQELQDTKQTIYVFNVKIDKSLQETKKAFQSIEQLLLDINQAVRQELQEIDQRRQEMRQRALRDLQGAEELWEGRQGMNQEPQDLNNQEVNQDAVAQFTEFLNEILKNHRIYPNP